tara:strand:- start:1920 stop:2165 length:246 start_codon:yes stop_codon:yes gene_type:complete
MSDKSNGQKPITHTILSAKRRDVYFLLNKIHYTGFLIHKIPNRFGYLFAENSAGNVTEGIPLWFNRKGLTYIRTDLLKSSW